MILWHLWYNKWRQSKIKSLPVTDASSPIWYLLRTDSKSNSIISSALTLIMTQMVSLFEYITLSLSLFLEKINLISFLIEFCTHQIFEIFYFHWDILQPIVFYFYHQFTVVLDGIFCISVRFCDNSLLVLKMRFQVFPFASKKVQGFSSDSKILVLLSLLFHPQNNVSVFRNFNF